MTLSNLLGRVEGAGDFDRDLDREIGFSLDGWELSGDADNLIYVPHLVTYFADHPGSMYPSYTESFETALGLVERKLPGWGKELMLPCGDEYASCRLWLPPPNDGPQALWRKSFGKANTAPLAILAALIRALIQLETQGTKP